MIPYDLLVWAESTQNSGYAGVAGKGPTNIGYTPTGDTIVLPTIENPLLYRYGAHSITKPQACRLNFTNKGTRVYGPAAVQFWPSGILNSILPVKLYKGDIITGYASNTNVAEDTMIMAEIAYEEISPWSILDFAGYEIFRELFTLTAGAAVTYNSGATAVYSAATNPTDWYDPAAQYWILGSFGVIGADGGVVHITNLPGEWARHAPGFPVNPLSGVVFSTEQPEFHLLQPIGPIKGEDLKNNVLLGFTATATNATTFGMILAKES